MKNISFGEQGLPIGGGSGLNQGYSQGQSIQNQRGGQYTNFEQYNQQHKSQQYLQQQQSVQQQQQQLQQPSFQGQNQQHQSQLANSQSQQFYSVLSNSYLSQQFPEDQVQFMQESKDSSYQQRTNYNPNLKLSQQQQQQQIQQQQQQVEQVQELQNNSEERLQQQQQKRQNLLLQQRIQDQQIQGQVHEVEDEEDDENYNTRTKNDQETQENQQEQGEGVVLRREYNDGGDEDDQEEEEEEELEGVEAEQGQDENQGQSEGNGDEQGEEEEEEEEEEQEEVYQCIKCGNFAEQALMMECQHHLCLNCASYQYRIMLKKSQTDQSQDLIQSIDCENCGISTPLPEQSIKVLLQIDVQEPQPYNNEFQDQQQRVNYIAQQQQGNIPQEQFYHQQQQIQQQQQQHLMQQQNQPVGRYQQQQQFQNNAFSQQTNKTNEQNYSNRQNTYQHQQLPSFSNKQNFNNQSIPSPQQGIPTHFLQDNQFHENVKASKQKKSSVEGLNKGSQNQSQNQSMIDKSNDEQILYCFTCESSCFSLDDYLKGLHKNHNVNNVSKAYEDLQEPIDDLRFKIKTRADLLIQDDARLNKKKKELGDTLEQCKNQIKKSIEEVILALQQKQEELIQAAEETIEEKLDEIDKGMNKVRQNLQVLGDFDKSLEEVYYKTERSLPNEIRAFNYYSENKTKVLETIQLMDTNLFHNIRDKIQYEFQLDTNSLYSHIDSIKRVKVEIFRLKGLETPDPNRLENKFYEKQQQDKPKKLLEQIIQQHASAAAQARIPTAAHDEESISQPIQIQTSQQQQLINSQSFIHHSNIFASPSNNNPNYYLTSNVSQSVADIFNTHKPQNTSNANNSHANQLSPGRYIKIKVNGTAETAASKRFHSPTHNILSNNSRKIKLSPSGRDLNPQRSAQLSNSINLHGPSPQFKTFSLTSQSTKQVFNNMLNSPSTIVKKYTPQYERLNVQSKESLYTKQNQSSNNANNSKNFKKNIEEIRKQGQADENNLNQINNGYTQPTPEEQASIAAQNRIRHLQEKLSTKFC